MIYLKHLSLEQQQQHSTQLPRTTTATERHTMTAISEALTKNMISNITNDKTEGLLVNAYLKAQQTDTMFAALQARDATVNSWYARQDKLREMGFDEGSPIWIAAQKNVDTALAAWDTHIASISK